MKTTLRKLLTAELMAKEDIEEIDLKNLSICILEESKTVEQELDREIDDGYGIQETANFTYWTDNRVYFPAMYDGSEWVDSVPRNPCDEATNHIGG